MKRKGTFVILGPGFVSPSRMAIKLCSFSLEVDEGYYSLVDGFYHVSCGLLFFECWELEK